MPTSLVRDLPALDSQTFDLVVVGGGVYGLTWRDEYACFPSRAACEGWLRRMRGAYRGVDGYRTCIVIRSGPMLQAPSSAFPLLRIFD